jgi:hypothetical protein
MNNYKEQRRMNRNGETGEEGRRKTRKPEYALPFSPWRLAFYRRVFSSNSLLFLFFICFVSFGAASEPEEPLAVVVQTDPAVPKQNTPWTVLILIDHPSPSEVVIHPPVFPPSLVLEQVRMEPRVLRSPGTANRRWTMAEFLFIPQKAGPLTLGPFEVIVPGKRALTEEFALRIRWEDGSNREYHPQVFWEPYPAVLEAGETAELFLTISDWNPQEELGEFPYRMEAPENAVLEELPVTEAERERGTLLHLRLIPLGGPAVSLGPKHFHYQGRLLTAPGIDIRIAQAPQARGSDPPPPEIPGELSPDRSPEDYPFPETVPAFFFPIRKKYERILGEVRELWDRERRAEALAELRRNEGDLALGFTLVPLRREMERRLGLEFTENEKWRPRGFFAAAGLVSLGLLGIMAAVRFISQKGAVPPAGISGTAAPGAFKKKPVTSGFPWGYKGKAGILLLLICLGLFGFTMAGRIKGRAVLRACTAYYVPDRESAGIVFPEGQPVRVRTGVGSWVYVESGDGRAGWVPKEKVVPY